MLDRPRRWYVTYMTIEDNEVHLYLIQVKAKTAASAIVTAENLLPPGQYSFITGVRMAAVRQELEDNVSYEDPDGFYMMAVKEGWIKEDY